VKESLVIDELGRVILVKLAQILKYIVLNIFNKGLIRSRFPETTLSDPPISVAVYFKV
jgi:hypothetical protein